MTMVVPLCNAVHKPHFIKLGFHQNPIFQPNLSSISFNHASVTHPPSFFRSFTCFNSFPRFKNAPGLLMGKRQQPSLHAINKPSGEPEGNREAITKNDTSTAQGPPFLTILAGIVVFGLVFWVAGSIVSWLIGLLGLVFSK